MELAVVLDTPGIGSPGIRPPFRWAGSKRRLVPEFQALVPASYGTYIEPFAGSAAMFFALQPRSAVLADSNGELMNAYSQLAHRTAAVVALVQSYDESQPDYYEVRAASPADLDPIGRAARFIYLNRRCFNGLYRTNRANEFNVPRGSRTGSPPTRLEWQRTASLLERARLIEGDFEEALRLARPGDFVYLDPPYPYARRHYGEYGYNAAFGAADLSRLLRQLRRLDRLGCSFLWSYSAELPAGLSKSWTIGQVLAGRTIAANPHKRSRAAEWYVTNNEPSK